MSLANRLYDAPHGQTGATSASDIPRLYVAGSLPSIPATWAYEGRLQIYNQVGNCSVKLLSGDLPPGYSIGVDNATKEVVIRWPSNLSASTAMPNANFSEGDVGWNKGQGWSIIEGDNVLDPDDPGNSWEGLFVHQIGESSMMSQAFIPVQPGQTITASIDVQTGNAREHSHGAAVRIGFYDVFGTHVGGGDGNVVKETTHDDWAKSSITIPVPPAAEFVNGGFASYRMHQDYALWVDNFQWSVEQPTQGTTVAETIPLSLRVTDSDLRTADWSGSIVVDPPAEITSLISFNNDLLTDQVGPAWTLNSQTITNRWGGGSVVVPFLDDVLSRGGNAMNVCPDTNAGDGTYDYQPFPNRGIRRFLGDGALNDSDFCIEMFVRLNLHHETDGAEQSFFKLITADNTRIWFGCRTNATNNPFVYDWAANMVQTETHLPIYLPSGQYLHYALTRSGNIITSWINGVKAVVWTVNPSGISFASTTEVLLGHVDGNSQTSFGWPGQIDSFRITKDWARYTENFTPPLTLLG